MPSRLLQGCRELSRLRSSMNAEFDSREHFNRLASITLDHRLLNAAFSLAFLGEHESVLLAEAAGVGKGFLSSIVGHACIRTGYTVDLVHTDYIFTTTVRVRVDNSVDRVSSLFLNSNRALKNGSACLTMRLWASVPWTSWPWPATRLSSRASDTGQGCLTAGNSSVGRIWSNLPKAIRLKPQSPAPG